MKAVSAQVERCCVYVKPQKIMHYMHGIIPWLFDSWANPVVHLLLLKSSMVNDFMAIGDVLLMERMKINEKSDEVGQLLAKCFYYINSNGFYWGTNAHGSSQ